METLCHLRPRRCEGVRNNTFSPRSVPTQERRVAGIAWNSDAFGFKSGRGSGKWVNDPALARRPRTAVGAASRCHYRLQSRTSHHTRRHITSRWILILCPGEEPKDHWPDTSHCPIPHSSTYAHLPTISLHYLFYVRDTDFSLCFFYFFNGLKTLFRLSLPY